MLVHCVEIAECWSQLDLQLARYVKHLTASFQAPIAGMEALPTAASAPGTAPASFLSPTSAPGAGNSRRGGGGGGDVALGLFSKIAAARKEKLSSIVRDSSLHGHSSPTIAVLTVLLQARIPGNEIPRPFSNHAKRASSPALQPANHFPEIADQGGTKSLRYALQLEMNDIRWENGLGSASRGSARTPETNPRKITVHNFAQNLRWAKQPTPVDASLAVRSRSVSLSPQRAADPSALLPGVSGQASPMFPECAPRRSVIAPVPSIESVLSLRPPPPNTGCWLMDREQ